MEDAAGRLLTLLISLGTTPARARPLLPSSVPPQLIEDELFFLRLFVTLFCLKFTRHPTWRQHGHAVFELLGSIVLRRFLKHDPETAFQVFQHRMGVYGSIINNTALPQDVTVMAGGVGLAFAVHCGIPENRSLCELASAEFNDTFDALERFFSQHRMV